MRKILLLVFLLPVLLFAQRKDVFIDAGIYQVNYSEVYQQPTKIKYHIECPNGTASRKGMDFYTVDSVITSDNADYANNVWDNTTIDISGTKCKTKTGTISSFFK